MTQLHRISVRLTKGQKEKVMRAYKNNEEVTIRLLKSALSGNDVLMVPMSTVKSKFHQKSNILKIFRQISKKLIWLIFLN